MSGKRQNYLSWEEFYMGNAILASMRSKDPNNQIGACLVDEEEHKILSVGYNGLPNGMDDDTFDWASSGELTGVLKNIKDYYVVHAERNAVINFPGSLKELRGKTLYVTWFPCTECTKELIQIGIKKIVYLRAYSKEEIVEISEIMMDHADIEIIEYNQERTISREEAEGVANSIQEEIKKLSLNSRK